MGYLWIAPTLAVGIGLAVFLRPARKPEDTTPAVPAADDARLTAEDTAKAA